MALRRYKGNCGTRKVSRLLKNGLHDSNIFHEFAKRTSEIFFRHSKRNFVSPRGDVISSIRFGSICPNGSELSAGYFYPINL